MHVAVLGESAGWHVGRLAKAIRDRGHVVTVVGWSHLATEIEGASATAPRDRHEAGSERLMPEAIERADVIVVRGMPGGRLEDVIFRMDLLGRIAARGRPVVNSPRALEIAIDKYLSLAHMNAAGIPVPRTIVAQDAASIEAAWIALGRDAVVKPLFGSRGRGIERLASPEALDPYIGAATGATPAGAVCYLQEFIPHDGWDARLLVVGERVLAMRRRSQGDWRINVSSGARPEPFSPPAAWVELARRSAAAVGAEIAGVDLLPASDGRALVVEINAVPGWRGIETATGENVASSIAAYLESKRP